MTKGIKIGFLYLIKSTLICACLTNSFNFAYLFWMKSVVGLVFSLPLLGASGVDAGFFRYRVNFSS